MTRTLLFSALLFLMMPAMAAAQETREGQPASATDEQAVRLVLDTYISGTDAEAKKRLFSDNAKIISAVKNGAKNKVTETPVAGSYRPKQNEKVANSVQKIASVDLTEGGALVKVKTTFLSDMKPGVAPQPHIQYISLLKVDGEWKIVSILMPPLHFEK